VTYTMTARDYVKTGHTYVAYTMKARVYVKNRVYLRDIYSDGSGLC
jgi:hypothetical protein